MNKDQIEGKVKDITGRVQRQAGEWTGDKDQQAKGVKKQIEGKVQNLAGKVEDVLKPDNELQEEDASEVHEEERINKRRAG